MLRKFARFPFVCLALGLLMGLAACARSASRSGARHVAPAADEREIRAARAAQNEAIATNDIERIAGFWTEDVEIRRGLGALIVGRDSYRQLFVRSAASDADVIYQREPATVAVSAQWPLAYESGTWTGHMGSASGPAVIGGSYAAQWVKRQGRWLIRGEVFVALTCALQGCAFVAAP